jgi:hypothetical protein
MYGSWNYRNDSTVTAKDEHLSRGIREVNGQKETLLI